MIIEVEALDVLDAPGGLKYLPCAGNCGALLAVARNATDALCRAYMCVAPERLQDRPEFHITAARLCGTLALPTGSITEEGAQRVASVLRDQGWGVQIGPGPLWADAARYYYGDTDDAAECVASFGQALRWAVSGLEAPPKEVP